MDRLVEFVRLHRMGTGPRERARLLGMGPNTERQYRKALGAAGLLDGAVEALPDAAALQAAVERHCGPPKAAAVHRSALEPWRERLEALSKGGVGPRAAFDRMRLEERKFTGTYPQVKRLFRALRKAQGVQAEDVAIPVDTPPAEVAQVDFGYVGKLYDPQTKTLRKAWCFVMVLAFSRHMFAKVVFDQKVDTWLSLHVEAFEQLGGVVHTVVPDNLKAAVVRAAFSPAETSELNRSYRELARHYGFKIDPTPPYAPRKKGKVEAGVKYVKGNFFVGRDGDDVTCTRRELDRWVVEIAGQRVHGTTRQRPLELFERVERPALRPLPPKPFESVVWRKVKVHRDSHVSFDGRLYSVPWRFIGKSLWLRATRTSVEVEADTLRVATHSRHGDGYRSTNDSHLPEHRSDLRHRGRAHWEQRAARMGSEVEAFVRDVFDSDDVLLQLRAVQAIVTYLERFPQARAQAACARARHFGSLSYGAIKNILTKALDLEPLPNAPAPAAAGALSNPKFARNVTELFYPMETGHEPH